jgi:phage baseplate assembly protein W
MPAERVSKGFKDVSMSFQVNPLNFDLISLTNETAIARSIRNLILTQKGERPFNQNIGSDVYGLLFEAMDDITSSSLQSEIEIVIENYEPRVELIDVTVSPNYDVYEYNITIKYYIVGIDVPAQKLSFALQPAR